MSALGLIDDERRKQIENGYDAAHDDRHNEKEIVRAALRILSDYVGDDDYELGWEQELALKMRGRPPIERLTVAAAMIAAEIERVQRTE